MRTQQTIRRPVAVSGTGYWSGRSVTVDVEVDPALLGGLQIKMGSRLVDASIRTKLNNLTNLMKGA